MRLQRIIHEAGTPSVSASMGYTLGLLVMILWAFLIFSIDVLVALFIYLPLSSVKVMLMIPLAAGRTLIDNVVLLTWYWWKLMTKEN